MSNGLTIDASAFAKAADALERQGFERQAGRTVGWALRRAVNAVRRRVRAELRPHRKTGRLSSNVRTKFKGQGLSMEARVFSGGPVAHLLAGGVAAHSIVPVNKKVLTIHGPGRSRPVVGFAMAVENPGFHGDPYFMRGVDATTPEINDILAKSADTMARELAYRMRGRA